MLGLEIGFFATSTHYKKAIGKYVEENRKEYYDFKSAKIEAELELLEDK